MMVKNPHGQKLPAASQGRARTSRAEAVEMPWTGGQCGEGAQPPAQPKAPGSCMAFQHHRENQPGRPSRVSPSFSKCTSANPSKAGSWQGKVFRSGWPLSPWMASVPDPTAPTARLCLSVQRERRAKGILPPAFSWLIFPSLNVEKLNARFEFLIRLSSFLPLILFCHALHTITHL